MDSDNGGMLRTDEFRKDGMRAPLVDRLDGDKADADVDAGMTETQLLTVLAAIVAALAAALAGLTYISYVRWIAGAVAIGAAAWFGYDRGELLVITEHKSWRQDVMSSFVIVGSILAVFLLTQPVLAVTAGPVFLTSLGWSAQRYDQRLERDLRDKAARRLKRTIH